MTGAAGYQPLESAERVLREAEALAMRHAVTGRLRDLMGKALEKLGSQAHEADLPPFVHLPLLVHAAVSGNDRPAVPLAAATSLLFLGLDILDDLADGDLPPSWGGYRPAEISLAAATLFSALPQLALAQLNASASCRSDLQKTLAEGLLRMAAGQAQDLAFAGNAGVTAAEVEASVVGKSGEELATFAALAARLAGAPAAAAQLYAAMGRAMGTAWQLASDCHDIFFAPRSCDLANGTRTLPIALHLGRQNRNSRADFVELLERARQDRGAQEEVRRRLRDAGELRRCAFVVEIHCQRALRLLGEAAPRELAAGWLRRMIRDASFFQQK